MSDTSTSINNITSSTQNQFLPKNYYFGFNEREKVWQVFLWDYDQKRRYVSPTFENSGYTDISGPYVYDKAANLCLVKLI